MLRTVLILLIAIANPVQAFAAAAMQHCGPGHARMHGALAATQERPAPESTHDGARAGAARAHPHLHAQSHSRSRLHASAGSRAADRTWGSAEDREATSTVGARSASAAHDAATIEPGVSGHPPLAELGAYSCSACAACCVAFALPVGLPGIAEPAARFAATASPRSPAPRFLTGGPERPPRTLAA